MNVDELAALGITKEQAVKIFEIYEKEIADYQKNIDDLEKARDGFKRQFEDADATLKKFDGINLEDMQREIQSYKDQLVLRDQTDWIDKRLNEYGVASPFARRQIISECTAKETGLTWKDGKYMGFDDYMKSAKEQDSGLYQSAEEKAAAEKEAAQKEKAPAFTGVLGNHTNESEKFVPPKIF